MRPSSFVSNALAPCSLIFIRNHDCDIITLNYTSMTHCVGIYLGTVVFYRDLTRITVSDIKSTHCVRIYQGTVAFYRDLTRITVSDTKSEWI